MKITPLQISFLVFAALLLALFLTSAEDADSEVVGPGFAGKISEKNTTNTPLGIDGVYTGTTENVAGMSHIDCTAISDADAADDGFQIQQSWDGVNWDIVKPYDVLGGGGSVNASQGAQAKFYRIVYTNGPVAQTFFRLDCKTMTAHGKGSPTEVQLVSAVSDLGFSCAKGDIPGCTWIRVDGFNGSVGASEEVIWTAGGDYPGFISAGTQIEILSTDADDTFLGTGARTVDLLYLDDNFEPQVETFSLNGITPVLSVATDIRRAQVFRVVDSGTLDTDNPSTTGANEGDITLRVAGAGVTMGFIGTSLGRSTDGHFTIPAGRQGFLRLFLVTAAGLQGKAVTITLWTREGADDTSIPVRTRFVIDQFNEIQDQAFNVFPFNIRFPEFTDIWVSGNSPDTNDAIVTTTLEILLISNKTFVPIP